VVTKTKVSRTPAPASNAGGQRNYELMLVINPTLSEERLNTVIGGITQFILGLEGVIAETRQLGKRRLAYPIKHLGEGYYVLMHFKAKPEAGPQLEARLNILEEILRYLLVHQD
jgi:small subunit ribosomal protein S6